MSQRRFLGWEPSERHEHFDRHGNLTGWTIVTREAEWDSASRERAFEKWDYDRLTSRCGHHPNEGMDRSVAREVQHATVECEDCRAIEIERSAFHDSHCTDKKCICSAEFFWIERRVPLDSQLDTSQSMFR